MSSMTRAIVNPVVDAAAVFRHRYGRERR